MATFKTEQITLFNLEIFSFSVENYCLKEDILSFSFDQEAELKIDVVNQLVFLYLEIEVHALLKNKKKDSVADLDIEFIYLVDNLKSLVEKKNENYVMDETLRNVLAGISYSTCRGIMFAKGSGTILEQALLPVITPGQLFKEKVSTPLN